MCSIIYYGNINKYTISYFLLFYYIVTHSYCVPTLYLLVPTLTMGAPHVASCGWPYTILTHLGVQISTPTTPVFLLFCSLGAACLYII